MTEKTFQTLSIEPRMTTSLNRITPLDQNVKNVKISNLDGLIPLQFDNSFIHINDNPPPLVHIPIVLCDPTLSKQAISDGLNAQIIKIIDSATSQFPSSPKLSQNTSECSFLPPIPSDTTTSSQVMPTILNKPLESPCQPPTPCLWPPPQNSLNSPKTAPRWMILPLPGSYIPTLSQTMPQLPNKAQDITKNSSTPARSPKTTQTNDIFFPSLLLASCPPTPFPEPPQTLAQP